MKVKGTNPLRYITLSDRVTEIYRGSKPWPVPWRVRQRRSVPLQCFSLPQRHPSIHCHQILRKQMTGKSIKLGIKERMGSWAIVSELPATNDVNAVIVYVWKCDCLWPWMGSRFWWRTASAGNNHNCFHGKRTRPWQQLFATVRPWVLKASSQQVMTFWTKRSECVSQDVANCWCTLPGSSSYSECNNVLSYLDHAYQCRIILLEYSN